MEGGFVGDEDVDLDEQQEEHAEAHHREGEEHEHLRSSALASRVERDGRNVVFGLRERKHACREGVDAEESAFEQAAEGEDEEEEEVDVVLEPQAAPRERAVVVHEIHAPLARRAMPRADGLRNAPTRGANARPSVRILAMLVQMMQTRLSRVIRRVARFLIVSLFSLSFDAVRG